MGLFGHGSSVSFDGSAVGGLLDIPLPAQEAEEIEESDMDSGGVRDWKAGMLDNGAIDLVCRYLPGDTGQDAMVAAVGGDAKAVIIQAPGGSGEPEWTFDAFVMNVGGSLFWEGSVAERTFTLRITGAVTEGTQT